LCGSSWPFRAVKPCGTGPAIGRRFIGSANADAPAGRRKIDLELRHGRDLWLVEADVNQFEHVLVNLIVNARDAMPEAARSSADPQFGGRRMSWFQ